MKKMQDADTVSNNSNSTDEEATKTPSNQPKLTSTSSGSNKHRTNYGTIITNSETSNTNPVIPIQTPIVEDDSGGASADTGPTSTDDMRASLNFFEKIGYGLGHVFNDLSAGVWFSYTLLFFQGVLKMEGTIAGALVMLGQVGDAIATPIAGYLSDRYGTKRKWHIFGSFLVFFAFPAIFSICPFCSTNKWWEPIYFTIIILLFQLGWAIVQITHLAMIPELSKTQRDRSELTATRYSASVCSNVVVFVVTWAVLHARNKTDTKIGPDDAYRFRDISLILMIVGISMTVLFQFSLSLIGYDVRRHYSLQQHRRHSNESIKNQRTEKDPLLPSTTSDDIPPEVHIISQPAARKNFFKSPLLYQNAFLYVFSRLFMTTSLIYMPLWLNERNFIPTTLPGQGIEITFGEDTPSILPDHSIEHIATVPLVSFLASFVSSVLLKYSHKFFGHQFHYFFGSLTCIGACVWVGLSHTATTTTSLPLYGIAVFFGAGSSITMISSLCITADMIGRHSNQGGFIYSAVTFADKLITGVAVVVIEAIKCNDQNDCPVYYRNVLAYGCGVASILGLFILLTLQCNRKSRRHSSNQETIN